MTKPYADTNGNFKGGGITITRSFDLNNAISAKVGFPICLPA